MFNRILILAAFTTTFTGAASAAELSCNTAVQNWQNGSKTTCIVVDFGNNENTVNAQGNTPPVRDIPTVEIDNTAVE